MKLQGFKRITKQDFPPEQSELIDALGFSLNNGVEALYDALNRKVSLKDNILCSVRDVDVTVNSSGNVTSGGVFTLDNQFQILGLQVIKADNQTNTSVYPTSAPWPSYLIVANGISLQNVTGLQAGNNYKLRIVVWGS